jgi:hypothetical protein
MSVSLRSADPAAADLVLQINAADLPALDDDQPDPADIGRYR